MRKPAGKLISFVWIGVLIIGAPSPLFAQDGGDGFFVEENLNTRIQAVFSGSELTVGVFAKSAEMLSVTNSRSEAGLSSLAQPASGNSDNLDVVILNFSNARLVVITDPQPRAKIAMPPDQFLVRFGSFAPTRPSRSLEVMNIGSAPLLQPEQDKKFKQRLDGQIQIFTDNSQGDFQNFPKIEVLLC